MKWPWSKQTPETKNVYGLIAEFDESLSLIVDPENLADDINAKLKRLLDIEDSTIYIVDALESSTRLIPLRSTNEFITLPNLDSDGRLPSWFRVNRLPLFFSESTDIMRYLKEEMQFLLEICVNAAIPLVSRDRLIGIVFLKLNNEHLDDQELKTLLIVGRHAALAFENALLFKESLCRNERMFRAEQLALIGQFAAGIAHEVRNPLTAIRSTIQFLGSEFDENSNQRELASGALNEIDRLNGIVTDLLNLAKPSKSVRKKIDLRSEIHDYLQFIEAQAEQRDIHFRLQIDSGLPPLNGDPAELRQVILNLLMNSMQAMPQGGTIDIRCVLKKGGSLSGIDGHMILLQVEDEGPGIQTELQKRAFEPFFTTKDGGTGLGLAICNTIVLRCGGTIWIDSPAEGGTLVNVIFPCG